ncbi:hypothetical protein [Bradyrhizobium sp. AC87j1]|uniref:hypothetical protein n=1 Tax=Bradyrhizobium sp. AC87j1 TaxID=2055894 RepID=UPI001FE12A15|nr:hypothetical protein [Bradyrhizobium sp. AC87j1]
MKSAAVSSCQRRLLDIHVAARIQQFLFVVPTRIPMSAFPRRRQFVFRSSHFLMLSPARVIRPSLFFPAVERFFSFRPSQAAKFLADLNPRASTTLIDSSSH